MNNTSFAGKVVLVTGASSGIGETAAAAFQAAGATVFGTASRAETLEAARARNSKVRWVQVDIRKSADVKRAVEAIVKEAGRIDVLVNNAAVFSFGSLEAIQEDAIRLQLETNVIGLSMMSQAALPALTASKGSIINVSSAVGHKPAPGASFYAMTKAAVESMTQSWALELAGAGVRVNAIAPGPTETGGFSKMGGSPDAQAALKKAFVSQVPLGRMASSEEVSKWILHVADPGNTWMTGQIISIDGGMSLT